MSPALIPYALHSMRLGDDWHVYMCSVALIPVNWDPQGDMTELCLSHHVRYMHRVGFCHFYPLV